jgi:hypothetical protein
MVDRGLGIRLPGGLTELLEVSAGDRPYGES